MAHLLQVAIARNLRHIIVVLPYTNIITQSVEVYRKALCLEGEAPEEVVAEHHHQVEFKDADIRHLTTTWRAPIIVNTAVQFFETLAANNTARLRKLHELPGSAVFLDEAHAALPASLWPVCWNWLTQWTRRWNGHLVLASGSLPEFWRMPEFRSLCENKRPGEQPKIAAANIPPLAPALKKTAEEAEHRRVKLINEPQPISVEELTDRITLAKGPRIVVVNTVQSAAFLAAHLRDTTKARVLHLSTALTPAHRAIIIQRVKNLLKYQTDWVLVATSLVEAGMDFSFFSGFRQRASASSLIQLGGRVNRSAEWEDDPFVLDFTFKEDKRFPDNPSLKPSQVALQTLFDEEIISSKTPNDFATICLAALKAEFRAGMQLTAAEIVELETHANYPEVAKQCRIIQSDTRTIVVDPQIAERIKMRKPVSRLEVTRNSVHMYHTKIEKLGIPQIRSALDIYRLPDSWDYDPDFLGYMADSIRSHAASIHDGYFI
jgi:CRISPR-associated endonuclease/helicase Cas3